MRWQRTEKKWNQLRQLFGRSGCGKVLKRARLVRTGALSSAQLPRTDACEIHIWGCTPINCVLRRLDTQDFLAGSLKDHQKRQASWQRLSRRRRSR